MVMFSRCPLGKNWPPLIPLLSSQILSLPPTLGMLIAVNIVAVEEGEGPNVPFFFSLHPDLLLSRAPHKLAALIGGCYCETWCVAMSYLQPRHFCSRCLGRHAIAPPLRTRDCLTSFCMYFKAGSVGPWEIIPDYTRTNVYFNNI